MHTLDLSTGSYIKSGGSSSDTCAFAHCVGRPLVCRQGETAFSVALRAAEQVSVGFLTLPDSKLLSHRLVNSCC